MNIIGEFLGEVVSNEVGWRIGRGIRSGVIRVIRVFDRRPQGSPKRQDPPLNAGKQLEGGRHRRDN